MYTYATPPVVVVFTLHHSIVAYLILRSCIAFFTGVCTFVRTLCRPMRDYPKHIIRGSEELQTANKQQPRHVILRKKLR